ncbi:MAG: GNAT family N-acetyltransferase [Oscillochloris sp.]|nr:GNAT family N-acetyltransferase [Oscillochloris sp.]
MTSEFFLAPLSYTTSEFTLRAYEPGDGAELQRSVVASYEHLRPWMSWAKAEQSVAESEKICRRAAARYLLHEDFTLGIWIGDELAGGTGYHLSQGPLSSCNAEIGMWISAARAGQGLGSRVLAALVDWAYSEWPWQRLVWRCDTRNHASMRVAEKHGFSLEGTFRRDMFDTAGERRDTHVFARLRGA